MEKKLSYRGIWELSWPIILGSVAQNVITATDTAFLGRVGEIALGAAAIGGIFYLALTMFGWGFGIGIQIIVARRFGEGQKGMIGEVVQHALWFLLPIALLMFLIIHCFSPFFLKLILHSENIRDASWSYLKYRSFGIFFAFANMLFRALYIGIGRTRIITWTTLVMALVNIFLDYVLVFGKAGFPALGIEGAAIASALAELAAFISFMFITLHDKDLQQFRLNRFSRFNKDLYLNNIRVGTPVMFQNFFSITVWFLFFVFVENLGEHSLAVSNIIRSIYVVLMLPMWGFASATNTLVSFVIGQGRTHEVFRVVNRVALLSFLSVGIIVGLVLLAPEYVLDLYTNSDILVKDSLPILYLVSGSALILSVGFIYFNAVSGTGKTRISLLIESCALLIYLLYSYSMLTYFHATVTMMWTAEYVYGTLLLILSLSYLLGKRWIGSKV